MLPRSPVLKLRKLPKNPEKFGIIIELKAPDEEGDLEAEAEEALRQIEIKNYVVELEAAGVKHIKKLGVAFCGKHVCVKSG